MQTIFVEERDDTLASVAARQDALEQYAEKELEQMLARRLDEARRSIREAREDPLLPAGHLLLVDAGEQLLPRLDQPLAGQQTPGKRLYEQLLAGAAPPSDEPGSPWAIRLDLFTELRAALNAGDRPGIERTVRAILSHRARFVLPVTEDAPYLLAMLQLLTTRSTPAPSLLSSLLRDGLAYGRGQKMEGLQRSVLRRRSRLTQRDFDFLRDRIVELCQRHHVLFSDFADRAAERHEKRISSLDPDLTEPTLLERGKWYVTPEGGGRVRGLAVDVPALLSEITSRMKERGLLDPQDDVFGTIARTQPLRQLSLEVRSPRWSQAQTKLTGRFQLKTVLGITIGVLSFGIVALAIVIYRRRQRFVELKSSFVSAVSHELRTPLASIRLMAETLERRTRDLPAARDYPTRIIRDVDGLSLLVENILSFDRLSAGRWTAKLAPVRLADIVDKIADDFDMMCRRPVDLTTEGVDEAELVADADLVQLLLANLAKNASQYNTRERVTLHIAAAPRPDGGLTVTVRDNGVGIAGGETERIFDDFFRSKHAGDKAVRGSGLGLAICRKIMDAHKGAIRVAETGAEGTCFELRFAALRAQG